MQQITIEKHGIIAIIISHLVDKIFKVFYLLWIKAHITHSGNVGKKKVKSAKQDISMLRRRTEWTLSLSGHDTINNCKVLPFFCEQALIQIYHHTPDCIIARMCPPMSYGRMLRTLPTRAIGILVTPRFWTANTPMHQLIFSGHRSHLAF